MYALDVWRQYYSTNTFVQLPLLLLLLLKLKKQQLNKYHPVHLTVNLFVYHPRETARNQNFFKKGSYLFLNILDILTTDKKKKSDTYYKFNEFFHEKIYKSIFI